MPRALRFFLAIAICAPIMSAGAPVKLEARVDRQSTKVGEPVTLTATLVDAANQPVPAPKNFTLIVQWRLPGQPPQKLSEVILPAGKSAVPAQVSLPSAGLQYLWVKNAELLPGGVNVLVQAATPQAAAVHSVLRPGVSRRESSLLAPAAGPVSITLRTSPDRVFLADGHDAATVEAFLLSSEAASQDVRLNLYDSAGTLTPAPLIIPRGQSVGTARVSAMQPGTYSVEYLSSNPDTPIEGQKKIDIKFGPAITQLKAVASPSEVTLVDHADLIVQLAGANGAPIPTDVPRDISLAIADGKGEIRPTHVTIPAGQFEGRVTFYPSGTGDVRILVSAANLLTQEMKVPVAGPMLLLALVAIGGLLGGYVASFRNKKTRRNTLRRMLLTGLISGFLLYWACIFLGLSTVTNGAILNPLNAFAFAVIGGWLQTEVFTMITSRLSGGAATS